MTALRHRLLAVLFLAAWLVATQHCGLEAAADLFAAHSAETDAGCCAGDAHGCVNDGCEAIEGALYKSDARGAKVPTPLLLAGVASSFLDPLLEPTDDLSREPTPQDFAQPLDWLPTWQFLQRTALSPRAPSLA